MSPFRNAVLMSNCSTCHISKGVQKIYAIDLMVSKDYVLSFILYYAMMLISFSAKNPHPS
ncbi:hypothetical protein CROQUDRAFT_97441 [Cronartium quercuum f. sp. fusiforme G11]|uniref:Uncharacterized protein n=1 Tax=Cronartium quercuum f. sp. fusiforme G11 TaxID=708437 RepID=A0A9P6T9G3_9BASI|nr:hypothetical protein CROQUDRAFT_97441 [Cronartium quercuum f. sp. fusiforme G11]